MGPPWMLVTIVCVLAVAAPAGAGCAWVLWAALSDPLVQPEGTQAWAIREAFASQGACAKGRASLLARWREEAQRPVRLGELTVSAEFVEPDGKTTLVREASGRVVRAQAERVLCLPDSVDPRRPPAR